MNKWRAIKRGIALFLITSVLWGCGGGTPTPIIVPAPATSVPVIPTVVRPISTRILATATPAGAIATQFTTTELTTTAEGTTTLEPNVPTENPMDRPFLMKIDRISVIVGRGTLLEGSVVHGSLQPNEPVEILRPSNDSIHTNVLAVLISSALRDQVAVGDYAGILVQNVSATDVSPGMVLAVAGRYDTYEEAMQELQ